MSAIDLIVLGIIRKEALSAYDIQKAVEYRKISQWVKISTPSIYKKVIQLEEKGYIKSVLVKEGNMPEKAIYSLTPAGKREFDSLMLEISEEPVNMFLDFNAVIVNLESLTPEKRKSCLSGIKGQISLLKATLEENLESRKDLASIPATGKAVLRQQLILATELEKWIATVEREI
jgi:DNA-binding PadR family transcriptional regulator